MRRTAAILTLVITIIILGTLHYFMRVLGVDFAIGIITAFVIMQAGYYAKHGKLIDV